jgi:hypothetical protein
MIIEPVALFNLPFYYSYQVIDFNSKENNTGSSSISNSNSNIE